jgi:hypothetical protein
MPQEYRTQEEADEKRGCAQCEEERKREDHGWHKPEAIEPHEFGILGKILHAIEIGFGVALVEPHDMAVPKSASRVMWITVLIRISVMGAMMRRPPKNAPLGACLGQEGQQELEETACSVRSMREVAMVSPRDSEHPYKIKHDAHDPVSLSRSSDERKERHKV